MTDEWTTHFDGIVAGRPVTVQTYSGGGYRVVTNHGEDYPGDVTADETSVVIIPPVSADSPAIVDEPTVAEVGAELAELGFTQDQIDEIVGHFP